jgi:hypothetical protein
MRDQRKQVCMNRARSEGSAPVEVGGPDFADPQGPKTGMDLDSERGLD